MDSSGLTGKAGVRTAQDTELLDTMASLLFYPEHAREYWARLGKQLQRIAKKRKEVHGWALSYP